MCAPDFRDYLRTLTPPSDPPPPGWTWPAIADRMDAIHHRAPDGLCVGPGAVEEVTSLRANVYFFAHSRWLQVGLAEHRAGHEDAARESLRMAALMLRRTDELHVWGDDGWREVHDALLEADWTVAQHEWEINGNPDVTP